MSESAPFERHLVDDALALSASWRDAFSLEGLIGPTLEDVATLGVDVVAIGKAAPEMAGAAVATLGPAVRRTLVVSDEDGARTTQLEVVVGEHPVAGAKSLFAANRLLDFLDGSCDADLTVFLLSGGASSLCALPVAPLDLSSLRAIWEAGLATGVDITTLNRLRAATSQIAGGAVLRRVRTARSRTLIEVDNVVSGAPWVGSGLTYDYDPERDELDALIDRFALRGTDLAREITLASATRHEVMARSSPPRVENVVVADPDLLLTSAANEARRRGYHVVSLGSRVIGDVDEVVDQWTAMLEGAASDPRPQCVIGVGEITVRVSGGGLGGRCQEFAWSMAPALAHLARPAAFVARSSDGRDFVAGVAGGWVDGGTLARAAGKNVDWSAVKRDHDSHRGLAALDQLIDGGHTGWNLCDLYVALLEGDA